MTAVPASAPADKGRNVNADWVRALSRVRALSTTDHRTLARVVEDRALDDSRAVAFSGEDGDLSYGDLSQRLRAFSAWAQARGLRKGDRVALMMANSPDYAAIWLGLTRIGVVVALINCQLVEAALAHALAVANPALVIADAAGAETIARTGAATRDLWLHGDDADACQRIELPDADSAAADNLATSVVPRDLALLIYTSGTTGLPKAARISHSRIRSWSEWFAGLMDARASDRLYNCLPMYHSVGGVVAIGAMLASGGAVIVRKSFSARRFWQDVRDSRATVFQYIGELCRYLVEAPPAAHERDHCLRVVCGNGMRREVWETFVERFAIPRVIEFYAATEGSFSLFNVEGMPGAIGRIPPFMAAIAPVALVRVDAQTGQPARDAAGFCARVETDEPGEAIGRLTREAGNLAAAFEGYTDAGESERKLLRDVFEAGDLWYRTGDLMRRDRQGFFYFVDRIGDTYRWKGENVSTGEVEAALRAIPHVLDANVYGVAIPGVDGKAGMAAITPAPDFDIDSFRADAHARLPKFARPLFVRLCDAMTRTSTFKITKSREASEGFDPSIVSDPLFFDDAAAGRYRRIDAALFASIAGGEIRL